MNNIGKEKHMKINTYYFICEKTHLRGMRTCGSGIHPPQALNTHIPFLFESLVHVTSTGKSSSSKDCKKDKNVVLLPQTSKSNFIFRRKFFLFLSRPYINFKPAGSLEYETNEPSKMD